MKVAIAHSNSNTAEASATPTSDDVPLAVDASGQRSADDSGRGALVALGVVAVLVLGGGIFLLARVARRR